MPWKKWRGREKKENEEERKGEDLMIVREEAEKGEKMEERKRERKIERKKERYKERQRAIQTPMMEETRPDTLHKMRLRK